MWGLFVFAPFMADHLEPILGDYLGFLPLFQGPPMGIGMLTAADDEVDALNREMYTTIEQAVQRNPEDIKVLLHYLGATRTLERIADHATNIAEDIIYMTEGHIVRHHVEDYQSQCFDKDDDQQTV